MFKAIKNYDNQALKPYLSEETLKYHFEKHHLGYVNTLIMLTKGTELEHLSIMEIIAIKGEISEKIYNNAAQIFNHDFYWSSLSANGGKPNEELSSVINKCFGDMEGLYKVYIEKASETFGSGWSWLVLDKASSKLSIINTPNADNPLMYDNLIPILTIDLWEHSYYIDYRNDRKSYVEKLIKNCLNWDFANEQFGRI